MTPEQLKASILQYAMEGKLVKQNPNEEPASELLKKIENEKAKLVKEGNINKSKKLPKITDDEKYFDVPDNWEWVRLGDIYNFVDYRGKTPHKISSGIRLITAKNVRNGYIKLDPEEFISAEEYKERSTRGFIHKNDIFITTEAPMGLVAVNDFNEPIATAQRLITLQKYFEKQNNSFFAFQMQSPFFQEELRQSSTGTTVKGIKASNLKQILVLLPPLEEQKRIVAKIEKLMPLVDEYAESYNRLQKIDNEFEDKLKQSVLQYAMEGKLVKQNPSDEPASELIKKIENEKAELVKEGKIKKSKKLPAITDDEKPFDIPDSWEWVRLKQITTYGNFNSIKGSSIPDNSWVVDMKDVRKNGGGFSEIVRRKSTDIYKSNKYSFNKNAVLYGKLRPYLRKVEIAQTSGFTTTEMLPINVVDLSTLVPQYLRYAMLSPYFVNLVNDSMYGMKMPRVGTTFLAKMVVPLPPLEEQKRIVEKVEELQSSISNLSK
ncbi:MULTISPECIES: restriction endonuclease subunit S [unclassified Lactobacillus]|uniref:restriction endonuclease subunit S n=1 Tax=unclassified Lactobacillus TaxID=2620435 RepID=UPI000BEEB250|nr:MULTISPECIES: restriction endonuclease subunit S [unclassified Lactobacillus]PEG90064.1 type I restriction endonuclease [Lactobacillus sp. UMNPBX12]PEG92004.1 type I restriction endonuclease [Lactobacillus sp. UMNPBX11]